VGFKIFVPAQAQSTIFVILAHLETVLCPSGIILEKILYSKPGYKPFTMRFILILLDEVGLLGFK
jgi:hypothetical protein